MSKIMIVDDAAFMRMVLKDILVKGGMSEMCEAADGVMAVEVYKKERPDLVLLDITMPKKNGIEALRSIRTFDPNAKVVMCSAMGQEAMVIESIKLGAKDFVVKPFKPNRILESVSRNL